MDCFGTLTPFTLMPWIGLILSCKEKNLLETPTKNLTKVHKSKKALKHRTVGSANVPVCAYIYIYNYGCLTKLRSLAKAVQLEGRLYFQNREKNQSSKKSKVPREHLRLSMVICHMSHMVQYKYTLPPFRKSPWKNSRKSYKSII